jgi:hypothetical protein
LTSWPIWWQWKHSYGVDKFVFASITLFTPMFCQCAPPWLPFYPLFPLKNLVNCGWVIWTTLGIIWLDFVSTIMRLLGLKNLLVLAKYNTHNLFYDHVELNLFDNCNLSTSWTWPMWKNMASQIHHCNFFFKITCQNCATWAFVTPWVTLMRWHKWA